MSITAFKPTNPPEELEKIFLTPPEPGAQSPLHKPDATFSRSSQEIIERLDAHLMSIKDLIESSTLPKSETEKLKQTLSQIKDFLDGPKGLNDPLFEFAFEQRSPGTSLSVLESILRWHLENSIESESDKLKSILVPLTELESRLGSIEISIIPKVNEKHTAELPPAPVAENDPSKTLFNKLIQVLKTTSKFILETFKIVAETVLELLPINRGDALQMRDKISQRAGASDFGRTPFRDPVVMTWEYQASQCKIEMDKHGGLIAVNAYNRYDPLKDTFSSYTDKGPTRLNQDNFPFFPSEEIQPISAQDVASLDLDFGNAENAPTENSQDRLPSIRDPAQEIDKIQIKRQGPAIPPGETVLLPRIHMIEPNVLILPNYVYYSGTLAIRPEHNKPITFRTGSEVIYCDELGRLHFKNDELGRASFSNGAEGAISLEYIESSVCLPRNRGNSQVETYIKDNQAYFKNGPPSLDTKVSETEFNLGSELNRKIIEWKNSNLSDVEKVNLVHAFIGDNFYYDKGYLAFTRHTFAPGDNAVEKTANLQGGNCYDVNKLAYVTLQKLGIPCVMDTGYRGEMKSQTIGRSIPTDDIVKVGDVLLRPEREITKASYAVEVRARDAHAFLRYFDSESGSWKLADFTPTASRYEHSQTRKWDKLAKQYGYIGVEENQKLSNEIIEIHRKLFGIMGGKTLLVTEDGENSKLTVSERSKWLGAGIFSYEDKHSQFSIMGTHFQFNRYREDQLLNGILPIQRQALAVIGGYIDRESDSIMVAREAIKGDVVAWLGTLSPKIRQELAASLDELGMNQYQLDHHLEISLKPYPEYAHLRTSKGAIKEFIRAPTAISLAEPVTDLLMRSFLNEGRPEISGIYSIRHDTNNGRFVLDIKHGENFQRHAGSDAEAFLSIAKDHLERLYISDRQTIADNVRKIKGLLRLATTQDTNTEESSRGVMTVQKLMTPLFVAAGYDVKYDDSMTKLVDKLFSRDLTGVQLFREEIRLLTEKGYSDEEARALLRARTKANYHDPNDESSVRNFDENGIPIRTFIEEVPKKQTQ